MKREYPILKQTLSENFTQMGFVTKLELYEHPGNKNQSKNYIIAKTYIEERADKIISHMKLEKCILNSEADKNVLVVPDLVSNDIDCVNLDLSSLNIKSNSELHIYINFENNKSKYLCITNKNQPEFSNAHIVLSSDQSSWDMYTANTKQPNSLVFAHASNDIIRNSNKDNLKKPEIVKIGDNVVTVDNARIMEM